jgi:hypothetical protein
MSNQNLFFNVLTFSLPKETATIYLSDSRYDNSFKLYRDFLPKKFHSAYPNFDEKHAFTTLLEPSEAATSFELKYEEMHPALLKKIYQDKLVAYFKSLPRISHQKNFTHDLQVFIPLKETQSEKTVQLRKFTLKLQLRKLSQKMELVVSFDGEALLHKEPTSKLTLVPQEYLKTVIYKREVTKYKYLAKDEKTNYDKVYPIYNPSLRQYFKMPFPTPFIGNKYTRYLEYINDFKKSYLSSKEFLEDFPVSSNWQKVDQDQIKTTTDFRNKLLFKNGENIDAKQGFKYQKPLKPAKGQGNISIFFIYSKSDSDAVAKFKEYLLKGLSWDRAKIPEMNQFNQLQYFLNEENDIALENLVNPVEEIEERLDSMHQDGKNFFAYYFTPYTKFESDADNLTIYYTIKEACLLRNIATQAIEGHKMYLDNGSFDDQYIFSLENIELATLAKLGGTPWSLANSEFAAEDELIVGVGAFYDRVSEQRFVASAFSFENNGNFNRFELSSANDTKSLAGAIGRSVQDFVEAKGKPKRLIIHYYKDISQKEVDHIHAQLRNLDLAALTIFVVTIFKTDSEDLLAFNSDLNYKMPYSGTFIPLQKRSYLLFNNSSYEDAKKPYKGQYGYPFPIKLKLWCSVNEELDDDQNVRDLIDQVYQFSRIYFKSFKQQNLPVTIKYPEMVAKIAPHFKNGIPPTALNTLWFL